MEAIHFQNHKNKDHIYVDDIKLFTKTEKEMESFIQTIREYSHDIGMEFDIGKCAVFLLKNLNRETMKGIKLPN